MKRKGFTKIEISVDRGIYDRAEVVTRRLHVNGINNNGIIIIVVFFKIAKNKFGQILFVKKQSHFRRLFVRTR